MAIDTITVDNYKFELELSPPQIKIKLTDTTSYDMYEGIVNEDDIYVKPIQKFYSMIIKSLNKESNYKFTMIDKKTTLICTISYSNEMVDIDEHIKFTKLEDHKTKELILLDRIRDLEEQVKENNILTFCYCSDPQLGNESFSFDINSTELDFRRCCYESTRISYFYNNKSLDENNFNRFKKVKKIITNNITYEYVKDTYETDSFLFERVPNSKIIFRIYNQRFIFMPNVIEIIIHLGVSINESIPTTYTIPISHLSFPNLEKISYVIDRLMPRLTFQLDTLSAHKGGEFKKLKIIKLQDFVKNGVVVGDEINLKLYAQAHGIKLEIT